MAETESQCLLKIMSTTQILREEIESEYNKEYSSGLTSKINEFLTMRMNMWQAESEKKFMSGYMDMYRALAMPRDKFYELVRGRKCYNGLDLSKTIDLTASAYVFNLDDGRVGHNSTWVYSGR